MPVFLNSLKIFPSLSSCTCTGIVTHSLVSTVLLQQGEDMVELLTGVSGVELSELSEDGSPGGRGGGRGGRE